MKSNWIPTNEYYHRLLAERDEANESSFIWSCLYNPGSK